MGQYMGGGGIVSSHSSSVPMEPPRGRADRL